MSSVAQPRLENRGILADCPGLFGRTGALAGYDTLAFEQ